MAQRLAISLVGPPGSGKSSSGLVAIANLISRGFDIDICSVGDRLRSIMLGAIPSQYALDVESDVEALRKAMPISDLTVSNVVHEYLRESARITVLDGYPKYRHQVPDFLKRSSIDSVKFCGVIELVIQRDIAISRLISRGTRPAEEVVTRDFALDRLDEYDRRCGRVFEALGHGVRIITVDAAMPPDNVGSEIARAVLELIENDYGREGSEWVHGIT